MKNERYLKYCKKNDLEPKSNISELLYSCMRENKLLTVAYVLSSVCFLISSIVINII